MLEEQATLIRRPNERLREERERRGWSQAQVAKDRCLWIFLHQPLGTRKDPSQQNSAGDQVKALQVQLNAHGTQPRLPVTGIFAQKTEKALRQYLQQRHISNNGSANLAAWCVLVGGHQVADGENRERSSLRLTSFGDATEVGLRDRCVCFPRCLLSVGEGYRVCSGPSYFSSHDWSG